MSNDKITVLVVDDEMLMRDALGIILGELEYECIKADSAESALEILEEDAEGDRIIDLVLSDVVMPGIGGLSLANIVTDIYTHTKILLMSGGFARGTECVHLPCGKVKAISKPFEISQMVERILEAIEG